MTADTIQIHGDTFKLLLSENEVLTYVNITQKQILDNRYRYNVFP